MTKIISLLNQKGGVGRTTISTNLAAGLTLSSFSTLLIDCDAQGSSGEFHEATGGAFFQYKTMDRKIFLSSPDRHAIKKLFPADVIIIDGAPQIATLCSAIINLSDVVIIPVQPSPYDIFASADLVGLIKQRHELTPGVPEVSFLINRQKKNTILSREIVGALRDYGFPVLHSQIYESVAYPMSVSNGKSILCDKSPAAEGFRELVQEIIALYINPMPMKEAMC